LEISIKLAEWNKENLECQLKKLFLNEEQKYYLKGQILVWTNIIQAQCKHEHEYIGDIYICKKCGLVENYDIVGLEYYYQKNCHNCKFQEIEGGDIVPYGSTTCTTPEYSYCTDEITDTMTDEELEKRNKQDHVNCEHWEGR
jgi:hypothetical protein